MANANLPLTPYETNMHPYTKREWKIGYTPKEWRENENISSIVRFALFFGISMFALYLML